MTIFTLIKEYPSIYCVLIFVIFVCFCLFICSLNVEIYTMIIFIPLILSITIGLATVSICIMNSAFLSSEKELVEDINYFQHNFDYQEENIDIVKSKNILTTFKTYTLNTSLEKINKSKESKEILINYNNFCTLKFLKCFISLEEYNEGYFFVEDLHLQLNEDYTLKSDATKDSFKKNNFKKIDYKKEREQNNVESLLKDLDENGFMVDNYGHYLIKDKDKDKTDIVLLLKRPLAEKDYEKLMNVLGKWIDKYKINLHLKNKDTKQITDTFYYEDLKLEVKNFQIKRKE